MNNAEIWRDFWKSVNNGSQGDVEGLIWQKESGQWVMLVADPQQVGRIFSVGGIYYNPWTGEKLPETVLETVQ